MTRDELKANGWEIGIGLCENLTKFVAFRMTESVSESVVLETKSEDEVWDELSKVLELEDAVNVTVQAPASLDELAEELFFQLPEHDSQNVVMTTESLKYVIESIQGGIAHIEDAEERASHGE